MSDTQQPQFSSKEPVILFRYGVKWRGPTEPICEPMPDGYWTPWHVARDAIERLQGMVDSRDRRIEVLLRAPHEPAPDHLRAFKNFHRLLCERFDYCHDEKDWQRDQVSLIEWIAKRSAQPPPAEHADTQTVVERLRELADHLSWPEPVRTDVISAGWHLRRYAEHLSRAAQPSATEWWCETCQRCIQPVDVTYDETHDLRHGGCGQHVFSRPSQPPVPVHSGMVDYMQRYFFEIHGLKYSRPDVRVVLETCLKQPDPTLTKSGDAP